MYQTIPKMLLCVSTYKTCFCVYPTLFFWLLCVWWPTQPVINRLPAWERRSEVVGDGGGGCGDVWWRRRWWVVPKTGFRWRFPATGFRWHFPVTGFRPLVSMVPKAEDVHHLGPPPCSSSWFITNFVTVGWWWKWVEVEMGGGGWRWPEKMAEVGGCGRRRRSEVAEKIAGEDGRWRPPEFTG